MKVSIKKAFLMSTILFVLTLSGLFYHASNKIVEVQFLTFNDENQNLYSVCMEEVVLPFAGKYKIEGTNVTVFTAEGRFDKNFSTSIRAVGVAAVIKNKGKTAIILKPEIEFPLFYVVLVLIAGGGTTYALRVFKLE